MKEAPITANVYGTVQVGEYVNVPEGEEISQLLEPVRKIIGYTDGKVSHLKLFMAPIISFNFDCIIIPDIGGESNDYFELMPRHNWASVLTDWFTSRKIG